MVILLGFLFNFTPIQIDTQILEQANTYINELQKGNNTSEYAWAIVTIYQATCNHSNSVQRIVDNSLESLSKQLLASVECNDVVPTKKFIQLLHKHKLYGYLSYLLAFHREAIIYTELKNSIINGGIYDVPDIYIHLFNKILNKDSISLKDIPEEHLQLILFAIYYSWRRIRSAPLLQRAGLSSGVA
jgi:hypothetical protein